jgi:hypothetical protein
MQLRIDIRNSAMALPDVAKKAKSRSQARRRYRTYLARYPQLFALVPSLSRRSNNSCSRDNKGWRWVFGLLMQVRRMQKNPIPIEMSAAGCQEHVPRRRRSSWAVREADLQHAWANVGRMRAHWKAEQVVFA